MKEVTTAEFEAETANKNVIVDFWAEWCGPCRMVAPVLEELSKERDDITFIKVNVDDEPTLAAQFGIRSIPTILYLKNGLVADKRVGAQPKSAFAEMLKK